MSLLLKKTPPPSQGLHRKKYHHSIQDVQKEYKRGDRSRTPIRRKSTTCQFHVFRTRIETEETDLTTCCTRGKKETTLYQYTGVSLRHVRPFITETDFLTSGRHRYEMIPLILRNYLWIGRDSVTERTVGHLQV